MSARNGTGRWRWRPITRDDLAAWHRDFEAPTAAELATYDG